MLSVLETRRIAYAAPSLDEIDVSNPDSVAGAIDRHAPDQVVNLARFAAGSQWAVNLAESDVDSCEFANHHCPAILASVCAERDIPLLHLSTAHVFNGSKKLAYSEKDGTRPTGVYGRTALAGEQAVAKTTEHYIIVRPGWIFGAGQDEQLRHWADEVIRNDGSIQAQRRRFSPTAAGDLARVLVAMTLQVDCGAGLWGVYHYCSAESVRESEFLRELFKIVAQSDEQVYRLLDHLRVQAVRLKSPGIANTALDTRKIFETFGIKQRSWHGYLQTLVKSWYE